MRLRGVVTFFAIATIAIAACGGSSTPPAKSGSVPKCPGSDTVPCMTTPACVYDAARQCESCHCSGAYVPPERLEPTTPTQ